MQEKLKSTSQTVKVTLAWEKDLTAFGRLKLRRKLLPNYQPLQTPPALFIPGERQKATGVAYWFTQ